LSTEQGEPVGHWLAYTRITYAVRRCQL